MSAKTNELIIRNACYGLDAIANDDGSFTIASLCQSQKVIGHYVRLSAEQAVELAEFIRARTAVSAK